jgi:hypothetical protein
MAVPLEVPSDLTNVALLLDVDFKDVSERSAYTRDVATSTTWADKSNITDLVTWRKPFLISN